MKKQLGYCLLGLAGLIPLTAQAVYVVDIQPIQVCDNAGTNCANPTKELFKEFTAKIWKQAGITFNYLDWNQVNYTGILQFDIRQESSFGYLVGDVLRGYNNQAPQDIITIPDPYWGASSNKNVLNIWFMDNLVDPIANPDPDKPENLTIGRTVFTADPGGRLAFVAVGWKDVLSYSGFDTIAHEIGHALTEWDYHVDKGDTGHLMLDGTARRDLDGDGKPDPDYTLSIDDIYPDGQDRGRLSQDWINQALNSRYVDERNNPMPEPSSIFLLALGLFGVALSRKSRFSLVKSNPGSQPAML
jgi:hypothetical protein